MLILRVNVTKSKDFSRFKSSGSFLQCTFHASTQSEAFYNVFYMFQLSGKLAAMYFPCFNSAGSLLQCFFHVSTQREAFYNVFFAFQIFGKLSTLYFSRFKLLLIAINR